VYTTISQDNVAKQMIEMIEKKYREFLKRTEWTLEDISEHVYDMYEIGASVSNSMVSMHAEKLIKNMFSKVRKRKVDLNDLALCMEDYSDLGPEIVSHFSIFKERWIMKFKEKTAGMTFNDSIKWLQEEKEINEEEKNRLVESNKKYKKTFNQLLSKYRRSDKLWTLVKNKMRNFRHAPDSADIPEMLAHICAIIALESYEASTTSTKSDVRDKMKCPHPVQLLAMFRLLGVDDPPDNGMANTTKNFCNKWSPYQVFATKIPLKNSLAQILTGEGKSIVIGTLAIFLALCGFLVDCVCYSKYLSKRDYAEFVNIFDKLNITDYIKYETFGELSSKIFNEKVDVRKGTRMLMEGKLRKGNVTARLSRTSKPRQRILLIDEVDTFFSKDFYGALYTPSVLVKSKEISDLIKFIWYNKGPELNLQFVKESPTFRKMCEKYNNELVKKMITTEILKMIVASTTYEENKYEHVLEEGRIGIVEHGIINFKLTYGYNTTFWYLREYFDKKTIDKPEFEKKDGLNITCGNFSYAEIPHMYLNVLGVTGTLPPSGSFEEKIIREEYNIQKWTKMPSLYGQRDSKFFEGVHIEPDFDNWSRKIMHSIKQSQDAGRAVLVFFEDEGRLRKWESSAYGEQLNSVQSVTSGNVEYINHYVKVATRSNNVTLFPKVFGRGLDFVCLDKKVNGNGGVHVLQTFLSDEKSEEIQIMGRTCRQGDPGSYKMILCLRDLLRWNELKGDNDAATPFIKESELKDIQKNKSAMEVYNYLDEKRNHWFNRKSQERSKFVASAKCDHDKSTNFQKNLCEASPEAKEDCFKFLNSLNFMSSSYHICLCLDKSSSMEGQSWTDLDAAKTAFLKSCPSTVAVSIITFNDRAELIVSMVSLESARSRNLGLADGCTCFAPALAKAREVFHKGLLNRPDLDPVLVFMSDGENSDESDTNAEVNAILSSSTNLISHFIFFGDPHREGAVNLQNIASSVKGKFHNSVNGVELRKTFQQIACGITAIA